MNKDVPIGARAEVSRTVKHQDTLAAHIDWLPPVLTTPTMIGWMEMACFEALQPFCASGETTVGTHINVSHRAPTGVGKKVFADAVLERVDGRFYMMKVSARNEDGVVIGDGFVGRAFIHMGKFQAKPGVK
jgi:fluoroacetyl-CoA thioesterase